MVINHWNVRPGMTLQAGAFTEKKISPLRFCQVQGDEAWTKHEKKAEW